MADRFTNRVEIWNPRYKDMGETKSWVVMIAPWKLSAGENIIWFSKAKHLKGAEYGMTGVKIKTYPLESNGKANMHCVPLNNLELIKPAERDENETNT